MENLPLYISLLACGVVVVSLSFWTATTFIGLRNSSNHVTAALEKFDSDVSALRDRSTGTEREVAAWAGYRKFTVQKLVCEANSVTSVYLVPQDGKELPRFKPGQFLTFNLDLPNQPKPVVRCYSLSDGPRSDYFRCSVKKVPPPKDQPELPSGKSSSYFNDQLCEGDILDVKAPSGGFFLNEDSTKPTVLLAAGIGITPMISMIKSVTQSGSRRKLILFYGSIDSANHAFKDELKQITKQHTSIHVVNCYSNPSDGDVLERDYDSKGWVSVDLLKETLPSNDFEFYLCGPPPFMESVFQGLKEWGVAENQINFEAFGPASIKKASEEKSKEKSTELEAKVHFTVSGKSIAWDDQYDSILELAEDNDIVMESGCRSGNCGSCLAGLKSGTIEYNTEPSAECEKGECLVCIAKPTSDLEIEA